MTEFIVIFTFMSYLRGNLRGRCRSHFPPILFDYALCLRRDEGKPARQQGRKMRI